MQAKRIWEALQVTPSVGERTVITSRMKGFRDGMLPAGAASSLLSSLLAELGGFGITVYGGGGDHQATAGAPRSPLFFGMESSPYANGASGVKLDESANLAPASTTRPATQASRTGLKYPAQPHIPAGGISCFYM
jgi:hypothetical protein